MKWNDLLRNVPKVTPNYNFGASSNISGLDVNYDINKQVITFTGNVRSAHNGHKYSITVDFIKIGPTDGLTEDEIMQGYMPKPSLSENDIKVSCNCPSHIFRFAKANMANRAASSRGLTNYHRKTNRAPNNPHDLPGMCYHVIEFVDYLHSQGFVH